MDHPVQRARQRYVFNYRVLPTLTLGVEWNPGADEVGPLVNWVALTETDARPALMFGTSSDRIGTPEGRAYFATVSKALGRISSGPLAGYVGLSHGTYEDETLPIGGLTLGFTEDLGVRLIHDGEALHLALEATLGRHDIGLLFIDGEHPGVTWSVMF
ncbi:MAG: hypothetical protein JSV80_06220 [Acidobacteriota bacterium]|nr:MAG: hypothetical protein JSV80_06220 [Acidobacteriota bacterium]